MVDQHVILVEKLNVRVHTSISLYNKQALKRVKKDEQFVAAAVSQQTTSASQ